MRWRRSRDIRRNCSLYSLNEDCVSSIRQALYSMTMRVYKVKKNRPCSCVTSSSLRTSTTQYPSVRALRCLASTQHTLSNTLPQKVEEILARTKVDKLMKIYNLPSFTTVLEFLTMLALNTGRLLRVRFLSSLPPFSPLTINN